MKIAFLLHFYQPHNQQKDILHRIVHESYLPLTRGLLKNKKFNVVVNINAALTELLLENDYHEVLDNLKKLYEKGQIEFTASAKYHAFLPLIPDSEVQRQVAINEQANQDFFGEGYVTQGFFPPEMSVNSKVLRNAAEIGAKWLSAAQLAKEDGYPKYDRIYQEENTGLYIFFRHKRVSSLILSALCHTAEDLVKETQDIHSEKYWFCVMDAETFGHHRIGHEKLLFEILAHDFFEPILVSDLLEEGLPVEKTKIRASTWTNEEQDFWLDKERTKPTEAKSFILWHDPDNPIHNKQWELTNLVIGEVDAYENKTVGNYQKARILLDKAISSDQYWWASAKPWWSLEMIEVGAYTLREVLETLEPETPACRQAEQLYRDIMDLAFTWQRTGVIRQKHLDNSGTFMKEPFGERTPPEWYNQIILEFEDEMNKAAAKQEFEKAVKWRDAVRKLKQGTDMFDVLHVVNELWTARNIPSVKPFLENRWEEYSDFAKDNFKEVKGEKDFKEWKKRQKNPENNQK